MNLIPTFEVGQMVVWHPRPVESLCPLCGAGAGKKHWGESICGTVLRPSNSPITVTCNQCDGHHVHTAPGWYILDLGFKTMIVPYTLIEAIKEEGNENL